MTSKFFSPTETEILTVLIEHMVGLDILYASKQPHGREGSTPDDSSTVTCIGAFVAGLPLNLQAQLRRGLRLFQWCPILFIGKPRPFTQLSPHDAETYIRSWAESRFGLRRRIFRGLRDVTFLGYYNQSAAGTIIPLRTNRRADDHPGA